MRGWTAGAGPRAPASRAHAPLSAREIEVLQLIADGLGNREIARELYVSEETVKTHVRRLLHKLHASSRAAAVAIAMRRGLVV